MRGLAKRTYSSRLFLWILLLISFTILLTGTVCLQYALNIKGGAQDTNISETATMIAGMEQTKEAIVSGKASDAFAAELDTLVSHFSELDIIVICGMDGVRVYHTNPDRIGENFIGGDEKAILEGAEPYISVATGTLGRQRRAFHGVTDESGQQIGFVMASVLNDRVVLLRREIIRTYLLLLLIMLAAGGVLAILSRQTLENILLGYRPEELVNLYIEREEVMNAMEEGLFAIDTGGRIIEMNTSAKRMLDLDPDTPVEGKLLTEFYPETLLPNTAKTGVAEHNVSFMIKGKNIISSRIPVRRGGRIIGAASVFRNKTELTRLAEELTGTKYMVDTLRAVNHEFMNKLHVILGYLEMDQVDSAKEFILNTSLVSGAAVSDIRQRVPVPSLAALLIGKLLRASELGITFVLKQDSYFYSKQTELPADCYIVLVGNLVENAMDELNSHNYPVKRIELGIYSEEGHTTIVCDDTGGGIPEEILFSIYQRGTTTKGEGHGNGYPLMKEIVDRYEGTFHIDTEMGEGTSIEINLPV